VKEDGRFCCWNATRSRVQHFPTSARRIIILTEDQWLKMSQKHFLPVLPIHSYIAIVKASLKKLAMSSGTYYFVQLFPHWKDMRTSVSPPPTLLFLHSRSVRLKFRGPWAWVNTAFIPVSVLQASVHTILLMAFIPTKNVGYITLGKSALYLHNIFSHSSVGLMLKNLPSIILFALRLR
jgi:hypothetical protein